MKKNYLLFATAAIVLAGCTADDDLSAGKSTSPAQGDGAIMFSMNTPATTRTPQTGNDAATTLGNMFIVWGEKNEINALKASDANLVFKNYVVKHDVTTGTTTSNYTAGSTTSNTNGWEYVGIAPYEVAKVSPSILETSSSAKQTIKYWDDNANSYTFTAVSVRDADLGDKVVVAKNVGESGTTTTNSELTKGYNITIKHNDAAANIYVADRVNIAKGNAYTHNPVTLTFRNFQSKIRFGIYETVPGYKVVITGLKYTDNSTEVTRPLTTGTEPNTTTDKSFGVTGDFVIAGTNTTYTVSYEDGTTDNNITTNKAKVTVGTNSSKNTYLNTKGTNWLSTEFKGVGDSGNKTIGEQATSATWDKGTDDATSWTAILPNTGNITPLTLVISYKLYSEDTGEMIAVDYKTVKVPAEYCKWKPNFAYTYLFKISDKSAELYPITFDACVETEETGKQETITTVSEPSWTTFATNSDGKSYKTGSNEYVADDIIYATLSNKGSIVDLSVENGNTNVKLYTVTTTDPDKYPITEGSVANAIKNSKTSPIEYTAVDINASGTTLPVLTKSVPAEDGNIMTLTSNVLKWKAADATVYAIEYINGENKTYKIVKINNATGQKTNP